MAEKTIILRPVSSGDVNSVTLYPSDTANENVHLLVNEAEADDDATYVEAAALISFFNIIFEKPQITNILDVKLHCRVDSDGTINACGARLTAVPIEESTLYNVETEAIYAGPSTTGWTNYSLDFNSDVTFIDALNNSEYTQIIAQCLTGTTTGGKNAGNSPAATKYTQIYLELTYNDSETDENPFYLRENGTWVAIKGAIYQKMNGTWVESSTDVFQEGDSYQLVTM